MNPIYLPSRSPEDWQTLLADPQKHWRPGYSAHALAYAWEAANGLPIEVARLFETSTVPAFQRVEPLLILPEYKVRLEGRGRDSQNDIFVLAKAADGALISLMIEGKVDESFGELLAVWKRGGASGSENRLQRLNSLLEVFGLHSPLPDSVYYQLIHCTASAVIEGKRFNARYAVMVVHSFSPTHRWFPEYAHFVEQFGQTAQPDRLSQLHEGLYTGWASGTLQP